MRLSLQCNRHPTAELSDREPHAVRLCRTCRVAIFRSAHAPATTHTQTVTDISHSGASETLTEQPMFRSWQHSLRYATALPLRRSTVQCAAHPELGAHSAGH